MSSSSVSGSSAGSKKKKKHAVSPTECEDGPKLTSSKRMRLEPEDVKDDDQKSSGDPHRGLDDALAGKAGALADIQDAQRRLQEFTADEEAARQDIRARGEAELDSLLVVGNDSISHLLCYFDAKRLCQCEMTCKAFQNLSAEGWKSLGKKTGLNKSTSESPKWRCVRYARASRYAQWVEPHASSHHWDGYIDYAEDPGYDGDDNGYCAVLKDNLASDEDSCECYYSCSSFPDELATVDKSERELFLRISANQSGEVLIEGFFPLRFLEKSFGNREATPCLDLCHARCPNWPEMESFLSLQRSERDEREKMWDERARSVQAKLQDSVTVTLVSFTESNEPRLVASVDRIESIDLEWEDYPEDDLWLPQISGEVPLTPHDIPTDQVREVTRRSVEFGWCKKKEVIGFRLMESYFEYVGVQHDGATWTQRW